LRSGNFAIRASCFEHAGLHGFNEALVPKIDFLTELFPRCGCAHASIDELAVRCRGSGVK